MVCTVEASAGNCLKDHHWLCMARGIALLQDWLVRIPMAVKGKKKKKKALEISTSKSEYIKPTDEKRPGNGPQKFCVDF